jgi:CRP/FNR family transcriptional regulator
MTTTAARTACGATPGPVRFSRPVDTRAARCSASDLLRWTGMAGAVSEQSDAMLFALKRVRRAVSLVHEGAPFESLYIVAAGTFKCTQASADGGEQVQDFAMKGDALGFEGICCGRHVASAVALEDSTVAVIPFRAFVEAGRELPPLEKMLHCIVSRNLVRRNRTMQLMVTIGADVRVGRFLLDWAQRQAGLGCSTHRLRLRMTRIDIASHLGIAHETVSRSFTTLAHAGLIKVRQRDVEIVDEPALHALHGTPRGSGHPRQPALQPWPLAVRASVFA